MSDEKQITESEETSEEIQEDILVEAITLYPKELNILRTSRFFPSVITSSISVTLLLTLF